MLQENLRLAYCLLLLLAVPQTLYSQSATDSTTSPSTWESETTDRIRAVFENGEWRPNNFAATWLSDNSGFTIRKKPALSPVELTIQVNAETGEEKVVRDVKTPSTLLSPDGKTILEFQDVNLFARDLQSNQRWQLTQNPSDRDLHLHGIEWSPDSSHVLFIQSDYSEVRQRSVLVPGDPSYPGIREDRFARIGEKIPTLQIGVVDKEGKSLEWVDLEAPAEGLYLGQVEWAGNSHEVVVEKLSRFRDQRDIFLFDIASKKSSRIFAEKNDAWVTASQGTELKVMWIQGGERFIVVTEKDGWRHAYLYKRDGTEIANLTPGDYDIIERAKVDELNGWFYFYASPTNATQKYLFRVPLDGSGKQQRITPEEQPGTHAYDFSPNCQFAIHTYSTFDKPPVIDLVSLPEHKSIRVLEANESLQQVAKTWISRPTEFLQIDLGQGVTVDAWMLKPKHFDSTKKYPVFVYVYGEPHAQTVLDSWGAAQSPFLRVVADLGYLVVSIDNRGTPAPKGSAWRRAIFGSLGPLSTEEQAAALKKLAEMRTYIDLNRVGIWGWSGGGSNTLNALFRKPDVYHVGIAVVPKPQPHLYNAWFQEIYMRTPAVNPEGYQRSAPIHFAEGLKGKLLIVTGSGETNTHIQIIEGLVDRLIELGKPFDYFVYPNRDHGLKEGKGTEVHVRMLIIRYLVQHLPRGAK